MNSSNNKEGRAAAEPVRLTTDGRFKRDPVFWPGGKELIYAVLTPVTQKGAAGVGLEERIRLMRMQWADRSVAPFLSNHQDEPIWERELAVSADGTVSAYCVVGNRIVIAVEDRKRDKKVTIERKDGIGVGFLNRPTLSPDGNRIVFMKNSNGLVALELWKEGAQDVELGVEGDLHPNFSPDGRRIVFTSRRDRDFEIYVMNADGSNQKRLTNSRGIDMHPVFSPNGRQIAFTSNRDGNYEIYVMNDDGTNLRRVTNHPERDDYPCWHPDGRQLVFVGERNSRFDLYMVDVPE